MDLISQTILKDIQRRVDETPIDVAGKLSDGYHTFDELYEHRVQLYIAFCKLLEEHNKLQQLQKESTKTIRKIAWKSKAHSDSSVWNGWFLLGVFRSFGKQITYHIPESKWNECGFAETLDKAPEFDGHTSADVLERLKSL